MSYASDAQFSDSTSKKIQKCVSSAVGRYDLNSHYIKDRICVI